MVVDFVCVWGKECENWDDPSGVSVLSVYQGDRS